MGKILWPGMSKDIRQMVDTCETCQDRKPRNQRETLLQHDEGDTLWNKIGLGHCEIQVRQYLIAVDYYSNFIEADKLTTTTSLRVIALQRKQFVPFVVPRNIVSDGGPQFESKAFETFIK